ncbi:MAG: hypothetical protein ACXWCK_33330, partial [Burkholderiales bacterium]
MLKTGAPPGIIFFVVMEIMKTSPLAFASSILILGTSGALAADVRLQKVPPLAVEQAPAYPENLARYHLGADVQTA